MKIPIGKIIESSPDSKLKKEAKRIIELAIANKERAKQRKQINKYINK